MVKPLSTVKNAPRDSQTYIEKRRGEKEKIKGYREGSKGKRAIKPIIKPLSENG